MKTRLPLVAPHRREHTYCAYCPKLCRFACPVSTVQGRETTTPWGKMTSLHHVAAGQLPFDTAHATTWYACTGCMRCKEFCDHDNDVASALDAGRAEAVREGQAPEAARAVIARHPARREKAWQATRALFPDAIGARSRRAFLPGCTGCVLRPEDARAGHRVARTLAGAERVIGDCCGLPLLEAGDVDGFRTAAARVLESLSTSEETIVQDPGCLHALRITAPRLGLRHDVRLRHLSEVAAEHLEAFQRVPIEGPVRYHDPCRLGRGLGIYDPPRAALARVLGRPPEELGQHRARSECSGAGGQLPRTDRETADAIADDRLVAHRRAGGGTLVTACPGSAHQLARRGAEVLELASVLARALPT